jgi:cyclase
MLKKRLIAALTFNDGILFRTKNFKADYRYTSNFVDLWSIDELVLIDVSKKKEKKLFAELISSFSKQCFVPITAGGGIKTIDDADLFFKYGADKILIGSGGLENPNLLKSISIKYGSQSIIQSIDCKKNINDSKEYIVMKDSGLTQTNKKPLEWLQEAIRQGAGEILINSVDNDGGLLGFDLELIKYFKDNLSCPVLLLGGCGNWNHMLDLFKTTGVSAACTQNIYHFTEESIKLAKNFLIQNRINIRI